MDNSNMLTVREAAVKATVSEALIRRWMIDGLLPYFRLGAKGKRGHIRIAAEDLENVLSTFRVCQLGPEPVKAPARVQLNHLKLK